MGRMLWTHCVSSVISVCLLRAAVLLSWGSVATVQQQPWPSSLNLLFRLHSYSEHKRKRKSLRGTEQPPASPRHGQDRSSSHHHPHDFRNMLRLQDAVLRQPTTRHVRSAVSRQVSPPPVPLSTALRRQGQGETMSTAGRTGARWVHLFAAFAPDCFDSSVLRTPLSM